MREQHHHIEAQLVQLLGEKVYKQMKDKKHFCTYLKDNSCFLNFSVCDISADTPDDYAVYCYCNPSNFVVISTSAQCRHLAAQIATDGDPYVQLITFINELIINDIDILEDLDAKITTLEDTLLESKRNLQGTVQRIVALRRQLLHIKRYYEQLQLVIDDLSENTKETLSEVVMRRCTMLSKRIEQLLNSVQDLRESITQTREVYQTQIDTEQNNIMKIFTIITTIFMPLTLIVGWYGMNFEVMPELHWMYGYPYVISLSIVVCLGCAFVFKKKKWF